MLIEKDERLIKNKKVADVFSSYFQSISSDVEVFKWPLGSAVDRIIGSIRFHPIIKNIKRNYKIAIKFSFMPVSEEFVKRHCK